MRDLDQIALCNTRKAGCAARARCRPIGALCTATGLALLLTHCHVAADDSIVTDRPGFGESSDVVGKSRLQIETSMALERNHADGVATRTLTTPTLFRYGVSDTLELRLETDGRVIERSRDDLSGQAMTQRGYADTSLGLKYHAMDQNGWRPSIGLLLHADLPSGSSQFRGNGVRPSLRVAAEWELPSDYSLGAITGLVVDKNDTGKRFAASLFGITLGLKLTEKTRVFAELSAPQIARAENGGTFARTDIGATYLLTKDCQIDTALSRGLNSNTPDLALTIGFSIRY